MDLLSAPVHPHLADTSSAVRPRACRCTDEVRAAAAAYRTATDRYERLMRHRIANPIAVISGMAETLCTVEGLDEGLVRAMLQVIRGQAGELGRISIEPRALCEIERPLEPWPANARRRSTVFAAGPMEVLA